MRGPLGGGRVAAPDRGADRDVGKPRRAQLGADARERLVEVLVDVVPERLERRDVEDAGLVGERAAAAVLLG